MARGGACRSPVARCHSVSRSKDLSAIAVDGHVYSVDRAIKGVRRLGEEWTTPRKAGIGLVTTFSGFCNEHDTELFKLIDSGQMPLNEYGLAQLGYRAIAREVYTKRIGLSLEQSAHEIPGLTGRERREHLKFMRWFHGWTRLALADLERVWAAFDAAAWQGDTPIEGVAFRLRQPPDIMVSGVVAPKWDALGDQIQDPRQTREMQYWTCFLCASGTEGLAVFAWPKAHRSVARHMLTSLRSTHDFANAIAGYVLQTFENAVLAPSWYESLSSRARQTIERFVNNYYTFPGNRHDTPVIEAGVRLVDWEVVEEVSI